MRQITAIRAILWISVIGALFSGYLTFSEMFLKICALGNLGTCSNVFSIPACLYGFVMYLALFVLSIVALNSKK